MAKYTAKIRASPAFKAKVQAADKGHSPGYKPPSYTLPVSKLTPRQRTERAWIAKTKTPIIPGSNITQAQLASETKGAVQEKYGPAEQQAQANLASAKQFAGQQNDWYTQYLQAAAANQRAVADAGARANAEIQGLMGAAPAGSGDQQAQQASNVRQALLASVGGLVSGQARSANVNASNTANVVAPGQALQGRKSAQGIIQKAINDLSTIAGQKGGYAAQYKGQKLSDEQRNVLAAQTLSQNGQIAGAKLKVAGAKVVTDANSKAANLKASNQKWARATHPGTDVSNGAWQLWGTQGAAGAKKRQDALAAHQNLTHPPKPPKTPKPTGKDEFGNTPVQRRAATDAYQKAFATAKYVWVHVGPGSAKPRAGLGNWRQLADLLTAAYGLNVDDAIAAAQMEVLGYVAPKTRLTMRRRGVTIDLPPAPATKKPVTAGTSPAHTGAGY